MLAVPVLRRGDEDCVDGLGVEQASVVASPAMLSRNLRHECPGAHDHFGFGSVLMAPFLSSWC
jgi:hypothetical protein